MSSQVSLGFAEVYSQNWNSDSDFIVTINGHLQDGLVWSSLGLKHSAKHAHRDIAMDGDVTCEWLDLLPAWVKWAREKNSVRTLKTQKKHSDKCVVVRTRGALSPSLFIKLLMWAIQSNSDLHIFTTQKNSATYYQEAKLASGVIIQGKTKDMEWFMAPSSKFVDRLLVLEGGRE